MVERKRVFLAVALVAIVLVAIGISWFLVLPTVDFWLDPNYYFLKDEESWVTINFQNNASAAGTRTPIICKNNGLLPATFEITVVFSGAAFSKDTPMPYQQINDTAAVFTFSVGGFQEKKADVYFSILNDTRFSISLSLASDQALLRVANAQRSSLPWDRSYRELHYGFYDNRFVAAVIG
jgi:hypothetical protein